VPLSSLRGEGPNLSGSETAGSNPLPSSANLFHLVNRGLDHPFEPAASCLRQQEQGEDPADGTAVASEQPRSVFTAIPGVGFPARPPQVIRLDFGPSAVSGVATTLPPVEGKPYPHFVPAVDRDGNEVTGLPDLTVPLATYTGWNLRHPQMGAPDRLMSLMGSTIPFPATPEEGAGRGDPRRSVAALSEQGSVP
jgi:hypothetical protein